MKVIRNGSNFDRVDIGGIKIDRYSFEQVVEKIIAHADSDDEPKYVVTPNAQHIMLLQSNGHLREIYRDAFLAVPDGVPLLWAAKFLRTPLSDRVNGTDLFERLCEIAAQKKLKVFLLGGRPGASEAAQKVLQQRYSNLNIIGTYCPPYQFEFDSTELANINAKLKADSPDLLFVGLGAPKQEYWIYDNYQQLGIPMSIGIGVSFELVAGMVKRAPVWMQKIGMEWFFRLLVEPRRLWRRYILGNPSFIWLVLKQRFLR